jgi:hypothetical protein
MQRKFANSIVFIVCCLVLSGCANYYNSKSTDASSFAAAPRTADQAPPEIEARLLNGPERNNVVIEVLTSKRDQIDALPTRSKVCVVADWGILALNANDLKQATHFLDDAATIVSSVTVAGEQEKNATKLTGSESQKTFKGEPHERTIIYIYRGLLHLAKGDVDNAHASFLSATLEDASAQESGERCNWLTADLMTLWCKHLMGSSSADEFAERCRARYSAEFSGNEALLNPNPNSAVVLIALGQGPRKTTTMNKDKTINLSYEPTLSKISRIELSGTGLKADLPQADDVYVQAETRGRRNMDEILTKKGKAKRATSGIGTGVATMGSIGGAIVPGLGLLTAVIADSTIRQSANIDTGADVRQLYCAPGKFHIAFVNKSVLSAGLTIRAYGDDGKILAQKTLQIPPGFDGPMVISGVLPF